MKLTRERLLSVLPEIQDIENEAWREACISIWQEAYEETCWEDILDAPNNLACPSDSLVRHTRGVLAGAIKLSEGICESQGITIDTDRLRLIALLYDVCKLLEIEKDQEGFRKTEIGETMPHGYYSAHLCMKHGLPEDICQSVLSHSQFIANTPRTLEGVLLCYADLADADAVFFTQGKPLLLRYCKV